MKILETERLILRTWKSSDVLPMTAISSDTMVMEHFPAIQDRAATQALVDRMNQHFEKFGYAAYAVEIKDTHEFIGFVGLRGSFQEGTEFPNTPLQPFTSLGCSQ